MAATLNLAQRIPLPVLGGPLRGMRWLPLAGGKTARLLTGSYEPAQSARFCDAIGPGDVVFDVGAAVGYYTLLGARCVGEEGFVVAVEPDPHNAAFVRGHLDANRISNARVVQSAVGARPGSRRFHSRCGSGTRRLSDCGDLIVDVTTIDVLVRQTGLRPNCIKIDVEGAEEQVLQGSVETLSTIRPSLFLSVHSDELYYRCRSILLTHDYSVTIIECGELICRHKTDSGERVEKRAA